MPERFFKYCTLSLLCAALLAPLATAANTATWYRVELVVFSHSAGNTPEQWDPTPDLAYPEQSRLLPKEASVPAVQSATDQAAGKAPLQAPPLTVLSANQRELSGRAAAMQRGKRYRILFHEAWTQQITDKANAIPIVVDHSGDSGTWPELQGSIKLYVSRYLYLETDLWLNTQGEYLHRSWRMPAPPLGPLTSEPLAGAEEPARVTTVSDRITAVAVEPSLTTIMVNQPGLKEPTNTTDIPTQITTGAPEPILPAIMFNEPTSEELQPIYPFRHAVRLNQTRRMRSGEIHYLDHPMLGVIVKITPLAAPESPTRAQAD